MAKVKDCMVEECAYNRGQRCHALAITIGDTRRHPKCDTYFDLQEKGGDSTVVAGVGACKVSACKYNSDLECQADSIEVGYQQDEADCMTFEMK